MGFPTKVQLIQRTASEQWYINFPSAVAQAMEFAKWRGRKDAGQNAGDLPSTEDLLWLLRYETWAAALRPGSLYHFVAPPRPSKTCQKPPPAPTTSLPGMLFAAA